jgi:NADPH:quinone reductase
MQRVTVIEYGGPDRLTVETADDLQQPGPDQLLVDVEASGVNYLDVMQREGTIKLTLPYMPGLEGVGRVRAVSENVRGIAVGQRIAWVNVPGSYASQLLVPAGQAIEVPDAFTTEQALLFQALTAQYLVSEYLVSEYRDVRPGDRVLVHSAAGGVGQLLVQWFKHLGAWVVGTVSSDAKAATARAAGAEAVINYGRDYAFLDELMSLTDGRGVDLAIDGVGARTLENTVKGLALGGTAVSIGSASGPPPAINPLELVGPCARVAGGSVFSYIADPNELRERATAVIRGIEEGWLRGGEASAYPLTRAADAHGDLQGRSTQGKLYLTP